MRRPIALFLTLLAALPLPGMAQGGGVRTATLMQLNDVYEITPTGDGESGGLARVATLRRQLRRSVPGLITTLGGDFLSPSALGLAEVGGGRLAGKQMVAVLNAVGVNWATLGNHEFDVREAEFRSRMAEARFRVVVANVTDTAGQLFPNTVRHAVLRVRTAGGTLRLGLVGVVLADNNPSWVRFEDPIASVQREVKALADSSVDAIIALTHLTLAQDQQLAEQVPELALLMGGHEHENYLIRRGPHFTPIVKADANVRTVAVVALTVPRRGARAVVSVRFVPIDASLRADPVVAREAANWVRLGDSAFRAAGLDPTATVTTLTEALDGRESTVRVREGRLTALIAEALRADVPGAEVGLMNGGSIRIDDVIAPGPITQYDVIRILPFGGRVSGTTMTGALLQQVMDQGAANRGSGGFLHVAGAVRDGDRWLIGGAPLDPARRYTVATTDFLLTGRERGLGYLAPGNAGLGPITEYRDIRQAVMDRLRAVYGTP
ncbi:MAG TPA: bifunctional metallophosphatase/5'-nucleotidase [Gemmatimonadales bacterium]|nr:bifunctional metallophosphatase/5'-nucleotidase [Gemmatimonadales bacterium]